MIDPSKYPQMMQRKRPCTRKEGGNGVENVIGKIAGETLGET